MTRILPGSVSPTPITWDAKRTDPLKIGQVCFHDSEKLKNGPKGF